MYFQTHSLSFNLQIKDSMGKTHPAIDIFTAAIKFIVHHMLNMVCGPMKLVEHIDRQRDIHWVLTVPAIWNDRAKVFMRYAAIKVS